MMLPFIVFKNDKYFAIPGPPIREAAHMNIPYYVKEQFALKSYDYTSYKGYDYSHHFIKESDLSSYLKQSIKPGAFVSKEAVYETLSANTDLLLYHLKERQFSSESLELYNEYAKTLSNHLQSQSIIDLVRIIVNGKNLNRTLFNTILGQFIAKNLGWTNETILNKLMMACFFCDLGENIESDLNHVSITVKLLEQTKIHSDIILAVKHHHEYLDGSGMFGIKRHHIHPFAKIIRVCDDFYDHFTKKHISAGVNYLKHQSPTKYDGAAVNALMSLFKIKST